MLSAVAVAAALLLSPPALAGQPSQPGQSSQSSQSSQEKLDNPYAGGARVYVNPEWSSNAANSPGGAVVADQPTAVWLDSVQSIVGYDSPVLVRGLRGHLDAALAQGADVVQLVLFNAPGRECGRVVSSGELAPYDVERYRFEFIDPIAEIISDPAYAELRVVTVVEPVSIVPFLITHVGDRERATEQCDEMLANHGYHEAVGAAVATLGALPNAYVYLDAGHHGWFAQEGPEDAATAAELLYEAATLSGADPSLVHGLASNVAGYGLLTGDAGPFDGELEYALGLREAAVDLGFPEDIGVLVDTSRNGWDGGPDLRADPTYWCNQPGAGLGERPTAEPVPGVDAYAWIKPPGESDGSSDIIVDGGPFRPTPECDPEVTGALPDGRAWGHWFAEHFQQLLLYAHPPL